MTLGDNPATTWGQSGDKRKPKLNFEIADFMHSNQSICSCFVLANLDLEFFVRIARGHSGDKMQTMGDKRKRNAKACIHLLALKQTVRTPSLRCLGNYYGSAWVPLNHYIYYVFVCFLSLGQENHYIYNVFGLTIALRPRKPSIYGVLALTTALRPRTPIYLQLFFVLFGLLENKI